MKNEYTDDYKIYLKDNKRKVINTFFLSPSLMWVNIVIYFVGISRGDYVQPYDMSVYLGVFAAVMLGIWLLARKIPLDSFYKKEKCDTREECAAVDKKIQKIVKDDIFLRICMYILSFASIIIIFYIRPNTLPSYICAMISIALLVVFIIISCINVMKFRYYIEIIPDSYNPWYFDDGYVEENK